ncbi:MAG: hypothetical protein Q8N99_00940 [Nanoarchaeota archaeon]|nr:hypothetical protein [Nanoarchaeota archaeon]
MASRKDFKNQARAEDIYKNLPDYLRVIDINVYRVSLKPPVRERIEFILIEKYPKITDEETDLIYARAALDYHVLRRMQNYGRTRDEIISRIGEIVEQDKFLLDWYFEYLETRAKAYNPKKSRTIGEIIGTKLLKKEVSLEELIKIYDQRLLRLMILKKR